MNVSSALPRIGLLLALLPVVGGVTTPRRAEAVAPSNLVIVSQQDGGCATKHSVILADPVTGAKAAEEPGRPFSTWETLNEAKPYDHNNTIVALWAGSSTGGLAGVGIYDRTTGTWTSHPLPTTLQKGGPHSVALLPGGYYAVAHVGTITGTQTNGAVLLFDNTGALVNTYGLTSAHGVEWDESRRKLYATGYDTLMSYDFPGDKLVPGPSWPLPGGDNGHDIRRRRSDDKFFVTVADGAWLFDPDPVAGSPEFTPLTRNGVSLGNYVSTLDEGFDGKTVYGWWKVDSFFFLDQNPKQAGFCMSPYKFRWIWGQGSPVYDVETPPAEQPATTEAAEPFLWAKKRVEATGTPADIEELWLGGSTNTTAQAAHDILYRSATTDGNIPFVKFFHWGTHGTPTMKNFMSASVPQITAWEDYAYKMAKGLGDKPAYIVMEPEYDVPKDPATGQFVACSSKFEDPMKRIVDMFHREAENAIIINQSSFWSAADPNYKPTEYTCYGDTAAKMDAQGFLIHIANTSDFCTRRVDGHKDGPYYQYGDTLTSALQIVDKVTRKAGLTKAAFGTNRTFLSDLAVTSCDWDGSHSPDGVHQAQIFDNLADAIPSLYQSIGLRGVNIRTGGPQDLNERYLGIENEGDFAWTTQAAARIDTAEDEIQAYLLSISGTTPTFDSSATAESPVGPGQPVAITTTVTNTGGSLADGHIKIEVRNAANAIVDETSFGNVSWSTGQPQTRSWSWPGTTTPGTYSVHVGVFSQDWQTMYDWQAGAATTVVNSTAPPTFTSTASASPATVAPGGSSTISGTVTNTGSTLTGGEIVVDVYAPNGEIASHTVAATGQTINGGASAPFSATFTAPPEGAGTYSVSVVVTGAGGTPIYHSHAGATTVTVGPARFTSTATVNKGMVLPGATAVFTATVTNGGATVTGATVTMKTYNAAGTQVGSQTSTGQTLLGAGASTQFSWSWATPATKGAYTLNLTVTDSAGNALHSNPGATSVAVGDAKLTSSVAVAPSSVTPGASVSLTLTLTNVGAALDNAIVALDIYNPAGTKINQVPTNGQTGQNVNHGETKTYTWSYTAPSTAGTYTVKAGVWGSTWAPTYHYSTAGTFAVATPAFTSSAFASPSNVTVGGTATITVTLTNTGGALANGNVRIDVYNPSGGTAQQTLFSAQSITNGETKNYTTTFVPTLSGMYTVKVGVWSATWTTYHYSNGIATISAGSTFQPSFQVGDGANTWWIEVYTGSDVTGVDVIGKDGQFYLSLTKKSWGAWAATAPSEMPAGSLVRFIARRSSDNATAGSNNFAWLQAQPTTDPGWVYAFTKGSGASTSWVEVAVAPNNATSVEVKAGTGAFTALTYSTTSLKWGKAMPVPTGTKVVFRAFNGSNKAYSQIMTW